jgi:hypothetical protein
MLNDLLVVFFLRFESESFQQAGVNSWAKFNIPKDITSEYIGLILELSLIFSSHRRREDFK